ncbi:SMP-30/gluconolactonase/LRE family protein [Pseudoduganella ginsengisoli]
MPNLRHQMDEAIGSQCATLLARGHVDNLRWHHGLWWWCDPDGVSMYTWPGPQGIAPVKPARTRLPDRAAALAHSIAVSPDGRTLYFSDAVTHRIMQCDYDAPAAKAANIRLFADVPHAQPRGVVVDADGCLWSAHFGAGKVVCYGPDGRQLRSIALPAEYPTQPAFGGPQRDQLLVGAMPQPGVAGGLYQFDSGGARGLPDTLFNDQ